MVKRTEAEVMLESEIAKRRMLNIRRNIRAQRSNKYTAENNVRSQMRDTCEKLFNLGQTLLRETTVRKNYPQLATTVDAFSVVFNHGMDKKPRVKTVTNFDELAKQMQASPDEIARREAKFRAMYPDYNDEPLTQTQTNKPEFAQAPHSESAKRSQKPPPEPTDEELDATDILDHLTKSLPKPLTPWQLETRRLQQEAAENEAAWVARQKRELEENRHD